MPFAKVQPLNRVVVRCRRQLRALLAGRRELFLLYVLASCADIFVKKAKGSDTRLIIATLQPILSPIETSC